MTGADPARTRAGAADALAPGVVEAALRRAVDPVLALDVGDGRVLWASDGAAQLLGVESGELIGVGYGQLDPGVAEPAAWLELVSRLRSDPLRRERNYPTIDGRGLFVEESMQLCGYGDDEVVLVVARDVGERKRLEQTLWDGTQKLRQRLERREEQLRQIWEAIRPDDLPDEADLDELLAAPPVPPRKPQSATTSGPMQLESALETAPIRPVTGGSNVLSDTGASRAQRGAAEPDPPTTDEPS